jgi:insertion element IS1 protein InsB
MNLKCPQCQSKNTRKDGLQNGKQRWECKDCGRIFRDSYSTKGYHPQVKEICLTMYLNGLGFRNIERVTGITSYNHYQLGQGVGRRVIRR